jgi:hypothetical protein
MATTNLKNHRIYKSEMIFSLNIIFWAIWFLLPFVSFSQNQKPRVESIFSPSTITLSNNSVYKIVIHGTQENPSGALPNVNGLEISNSPKTFRSASYINGVPSVRLELSFQVKPQTTGEFIIPSWPLKVGSINLQVPSAKLNVLPSNQQDKIRKDAEQKQKNDLKQASFIVLNLPKDYLYEGETISTNLELFIWDRLPVSRIEMAPQKDGDAFSITDLGQPNEKRNQIKYNKNYTVFSWPVGLTATTSGKHNIQFKTAIRVRVKSRGNSPFNSPFFNDPFFGFGREESLSVISDIISIDVKKVPKTNRPLSFNGAIGSFNFRTTTDTQEITLGEPIRYTIEVEGIGNFMAMPAPDILSDKDFKISSPAFIFDGNQATKHEGVQKFEYIMTPLNPGQLKIPSRSFSFFNPETEKFTILESASIPIQVDPGEEWVNSSYKPIPNTKNSTSQNTPDMFQTENEPGEWNKDMRNKTLIETKSFWIAQLFPLIGVLLLGFLGWKRKQSGRDLFRQKQASLKKQMKDAISYNDAKLFFQATRERIRLEVGTIYNYPTPSALSSFELVSLLKENQQDRQIIDELEYILIASDSHEFANNDEEIDSLEDILVKTNKVLKKIK